VLRGRNLTWYLATGVTRAGMLLFVFLHKTCFLKTKKAEKAQKTKTAVKKTVFNFSSDMLLIFWRWRQPFFNASLGQDSSPGS
jgi:hypothetical protein